MAGRPRYIVRGTEKLPDGSKSRHVYETKSGVEAHRVEHNWKFQRGYKWVAVYDRIVRYTSDEEMRRGLTAEEYKRGKL